MNRNDALNLQRNQSDLDRVSSVRPSYEQRTFVLGVITNYAVLDATYYRWTYTWSEAVMTNATPTGVSVKSPGLQSTALSISELSNRSGHPFYSYGVGAGGLPGSYVPQPIAIGTYVLLTPMRQNDGALRWLIINTQAIDGACT
jgi:hypothetical protein